MKKWIAVILALTLSCTAAAYAAAPEEINGKELVEIKTIAETDADGDAAFDQWGGMGGFQFDSTNTVSADSTPEEPKTETMRVLKDPSDPESTDYCIRIIRTIKDGPSRRINLPSAKGYGGGIWIFNFKMMQPVAMEQYFSMKFEDNQWFSGGDRFNLTSGGVFRFGSTEICSGITAGRWYEYSLIYDGTANTASCIVTGVFGSESEEKTVSKFDMIVKNTKGEQVDFSYIQQMEVNISNGNIGKSYYLDDLSLKMMAYKPSAEAYGIGADGNRTGDDLVDYANPNIEAVVSEALDATMIGAKPVTLKRNETEIEADVTYDAKSNGFTITPKTELLPDTAYTITFGQELKTQQGAALTAETAVTVKTMKKPYSINQAAIIGEVNAGKNFQISVEINNRGDVPVSEENTILAAVYSAGGEMCSIAAAKTSGTADKVSYPLTLRAPEDVEDMRVKVFFIKTFADQQLIDIFAIQ